MRLRLVSSIFALGLAVAASAGAAPVFRVADVNPARLPGKVLPDICFGVFGNALFFGGYDRANGVELWRTDGTPDGVAFVADLDPGGDSNPCGFVAFQGALYFSASVGGRATLWRSDGTSAGTTPLESFAGSELTNLVATDSLLFFVADDGVHGPGLWRSDGTAEGTVMVADLDPGSTEEYLDQLTVLGDRVFFRVASSDTIGFHLEQSDGTENGTTFVHDMGTGFYSIVGRAGDLVYFSLLVPGSAELWRTDGSELGTIQLLHFLPGVLSFPPNEVLIGPSDLVDLSGVAVFVARDDVHGWQPWRSDGTAAGTRRIANVEPPDSFPRIGGFVESGGLVYFHAREFHELWRTDATAAGTFRIREFGQGIASQHPLWAALGLLFFQAYDVEHGMEPWRSDGTTLGTFQLADIEPGTDPSLPTPFVEFGSAVVFGASRDQSRLLWKTDGTPQGTLLADSGTHGRSALPLSLTDAGAELFFAAQDAEFGSADTLWSSDGTSDGTRQRGAFRAIFATTLTPFRGDLYFYAYDSSMPFRLWNTHGPVGPAPLDGSTAPALAVVGDTLFFMVNTDLWKTDGTEGGTVLVQSFARFPWYLIALADHLLLFVGNDDLGVELWRCDGTAAGTQLVRNLGPGSGLTALPVRFGRGVAFGVGDPSGYGLWSSDGTSAGTIRLDDGWPISWDGLAAAGRFLYYTDFDTGALWRTDGTEAGTILLAHVIATNLKGVGGTVFFAADDRVHGLELWTSTGYPETTRMVRDILPGSFGSSPTSLSDAGGRLVFAASDGVHGVEPWQSDGTAGGTAMIAEIAPGPSSSSPFGFERSGDLVFFSANDGDTGFELWAVPAAELGVPAGPARPTPRVLPPRP